MELALSLAQIAGKAGDVPVGAVVVKDGKVIASAYNKKNKKRNAIMHAEIIAINKACKKLKDFRCEDCDIYVTFEPCVMCYGAILSARFKNLYFGAYDRRFGTVKQLENLPFNHKINVVGGIMENECALVLTQFFEDLRRN